AITAFAVTGIYDFEEGRPRVYFDPSTNLLLPQNDEGKKFYDHIRRVFGNDETILIAVHADDLFTREHLETVKRLTHRIGLVDGIRYVTSLTNVQNLRGTAEGLEIAPLVQTVPETPEGLARLRKEALENPLFAGSLVSRDGTTAALLVYPLDFSDREFFDRGIDDAIVAIVEEERGTADVWITGTPHLKVAQTRATLHLLASRLPITVLVLGLVLLFSFRSVRGVLLPLVTVMLALTWTMGLLGWSGRPLNQVTALVPFMLTILGLSYAVHVVSEYFDEVQDAPGESPRTLMLEALQKVWLPVLLTGLTTGIGFLSVLVSPIGAIREFGLLSLFGIIAAVVASLTVTPALLTVFSRTGRARESIDVAKPDRFARFSERVAEFVLQNRRAVFISAAVVFAVSVLGATRLHVASDGVRNFPENYPARRDFEKINIHLDGATSFNVIVDAGHPGAFKDPENLRELERLQEWLESQPDIGGTTSFVEYIKVMNRAFHEDDPAHLVIPESRRFVAELLFFGSSDDLETYIDSRYQMANVVVRTPYVDAADLRGLAARIDERVLDLPEHFKGSTVTGNPIVVQRMLDQLIAGQVQSVGGSLVVIFLILWGLFLQAGTGFKALIPNILPVAAYYGMLGFMGIPLSPSTAVIAPMVLGVAIDDTIHYFTRFNADAKRLADERRATVRALRTVGRPVTYTTISICLGFLVIATGDLQTFVSVGTMGAFALGFAWVIDFTLTPALCSGLRVVTLWDTLSLDLGERPQDSIPVLHGLSTAGCRILAQMANVRDVPAREMLMRSGDEGDDMYMIIDGKVEISIETPSGRDVLATSSRGDMVGDVGFYTRRRTADVEVIEDTRLLRLTPRTLDRLRKRYPKIASVLFHNLNEILAGRVAASTDRLR
ncbi:MAG: MMPL family transporter, partial [Myxococcota bacterium]